MLNQRTEGRVEEHGRQGSIWQTTLMYGLISVVVMFLFNKNDMTRDDRSRSESKRSFNSIETKANSPYAPFAQKGDTYTIVINSNDNNTFTEDSFSDLVLDDFAIEKSRNYHLNLSKSVTENQTVFLQIKMCIRGKDYIQEFPLVRFLPTKPEKRGKHLFTKKEEENNMNNIIDDNNSSIHKSNINVEPSVEWKAYFQPTLTLSPIIDFTNPLPLPMRSYYFLDNSTQLYFPLLYINNFWVLRDHLVEINKSTTTSLLNFTINISPIPLWKFAIYINFEESMKQQREMGLMKAEDSDETKRIFLETNPYFLGLTCLVTLLHMLFEYLAFSNDVKFWRHRKDFKGLSIRMIVMNCYFQTIIFLYLLDGDETSWAILLPSAFGVLVEYWKLAQTIRLVRVEGGWWQIKFNEGYDKRTRKHDDAAVRYLMYIMSPILLCYTVYSAVYEIHKGWYSFIVSTQVRFIYLFGFALLTPQIFINYKMKTVTQLPWRTFVYRALNTVIDDLFAFIVKMPWLHRLACFRDDVVFLILLYQRWIYPVDTKRSEESDDENNDDKESLIEGEQGEKEKLKEEVENNVENGKDSQELPTETKKSQ